MSVCVRKREIDRERESVYVCVVCVVCGVCVCGVCVYMHAGECR